MKVLFSCSAKHRQNMILAKQAPLHATSPCTTKKINSWVHLSTIQASENHLQSSSITISCSWSVRGGEASSRRGERPSGSGTRLLASEFAEICWQNIAIYCYTHCIILPCKHSLGTQHAWIPWWGRSDRFKSEFKLGPSEPVNNLDSSRTVHGARNIVHELLWIVSPRPMV